MGIFSRKKKKETPVKAEEPSHAMKISASMVARTLRAADASGPMDGRELGPYMPPPQVAPKHARDEMTKLAMDFTPYDYANGEFARNYWPGYPILATLAQMPEYRKISNELAKAMTRKWVTLTTRGEDDDNDHADKIQALTDAMEKYKLQSLFKDAAEHDGLFGRGQLYIDMKTPSGALAADDETELNSPLIMSKQKIPKGSLRGFTLVEPIWAYPSAYNANNPLKPGFYKPSSWYIMGSTVHKSRMLMFISRPVPDLLKAAYNFGGLSMTQIAQPYVANWIRTRDSVSDLVHSFSVSGLATDLSSTLSGTDDSSFIQRAELFTKMRDNRGMMLINKDTEEFFQFNTPLSGLSELQAQAQEQMSAVSNIPIAVLLGITPSGLNASSEGEIRVWYDYVAGMQMAIFAENLVRALDVIQLSEFGEIDPAITFKFNPLMEMTDEELATIRASNAQADSAYVTAGILDAAEVRQRLAADPGSGYNNIDVDAEIEYDNLDTEAE